MTLEVRKAVLAVTFAGGVLASHANSRVAAEPVEHLRTVVLHAPPPTSPDPCWTNSRRGTVNPAEYEPTVAALISAVRERALEAGGLEAVQITIIPGVDDCAGRAALRKAYGAEVGTWLASWAAAGGRARIVRNYLTDALTKDVQGNRAAYGLSDSIHPADLAAVISVLFRVEWNGGDVPPASAPGALPPSRSLAVVIRAMPAPSAPIVPTAPMESKPSDLSLEVAALRQQIEEMRREPRREDEPLAHVHAESVASVAGRAVMMRAMGTSLLGVEGEYTRRLSDRVAVGVRVGILAADDEWSMGGRLRDSSTPVVEIPISFRRKAAPFEIRAIVAPGLLVEYLAFRANLELTVARKVWAQTDLAFGGGPAVVLADYDTDLIGWSIALSLERRIQ